MQAQKDFRIYWKNYKHTNKIPIECNEELKAAHEIMMIKNCRCRSCPYQSFQESGKETRNPEGFQLFLGSVKFVLLQK